MITTYHFPILGGSQTLLCGMESTKKKQTNKQKLTRPKGFSNMLLYDDSIPLYTKTKTGIFILLCLAVL